MYVKYRVANYRMYVHTYVRMSESKQHAKYTVITLPNCNCFHMQLYKEQLGEARKEAMQYKKKLEEARKNAKK